MNNCNHTSQLKNTYIRVQIDVFKKICNALIYIKIMQLEVAKTLKKTLDIED